MIRRIFIIISLVLVLYIGVALLLPRFVPQHSSASMKQVPGATATPTPSPTPILTVQGPSPQTSAVTAYLLDTDTGHVLDDSNGERPLPMASTTKIMTALIAIQTGDLNQLVTIQQDAYNEVHLYNGSSADLIVGDQIPLRDLIYALMLPSGDDAAIAIADALAQTPANFVQRMNLFAYHLRLFQTHYTNSDGLTPDGQTNPDHYTTAADLARLTRYAMTLPFFSQVVQTEHYTIPATVDHRAYVWDNTNKLLQMYSGTTGTKTGYTEEAGYCLVFSATRDKHHLVGILLGDIDSDHRFHDAMTLLTWGFGLPLLPPTISSGQNR